MFVAVCVAKTTSRILMHSLTENKSNKTAINSDCEGKELRSVYLLRIHFMNGCIREAEMMEEAHLLIEQTVSNMSPRVLPLNKADEAPIQRGAQIHRPVIAVQSYLEKGCLYSVL